MVALRIEPSQHAVDPGGPAVFTVHVVNQSAVVERVTLEVLDQAGRWAQIDAHNLALFPGTAALALLTVTPPADAPLGPLPIAVKATAEATGGSVVDEVSLHVRGRAVVDAQLKPRTTRGRRSATSVLVLHNTGNAPSSWPSRPSIPPTSSSSSTRTPCTSPPAPRSSRCG